MSGSARPLLTWPPPWSEARRDGDVLWEGRGEQAAGVGDGVS